MEGNEVIPKGAIAGVEEVLEGFEAMILAIDFPGSSEEADCIL